MNNQEQIENLNTIIQALQAERNKLEGRQPTVACATEPRFKPNDFKYTCSIFYTNAYFENDAYVHMNVGNGRFKRQTAAKHFKFDAQGRLDDEFARYGASLVFELPDDTFVTVNPHFGPGVYNPDYFDKHADGKKLDEVQQKLADYYNQHEVN